MIVETLKPENNEAAPIANATRYFGDYVRGRENNFDFLRFFAASLVIYCHSYALSGGMTRLDPLMRWNHGQMNMGAFAVHLFFIMSGFLITASFERSKTVGKFAKARVLRIFPALIVAVFFTVFVVGPLVTSLSMRDYFTNADTYRYLHNWTTRGPKLLPGVFLTNPVPGAVNGSLWTLFYELLCYVLVGLLGVTRLLRRPVVLALLILALVVPLKPTVSHYAFYKGLLVPFVAGMCCYLYRDKIPMKWYLVVVSLAGLIASGYCGLFGPGVAIFGSYLALWFAFSPSIRLNHFARRGDISYGLYIYAWPVQQTITHYFRGKISMPVLFLIAYPTVFALAALSWHFVEKRFIRMKSRVAQAVPA